MSNKKVALITGISGQDGSYLTEYLVSLGYQVHGIIRRHSVSENQNTRFEHVEGVTTHYGDMTDPASLRRIITTILNKKPWKIDEVYNLAAQSHVRVSFDMPKFTLETNGMGVLTLLDTLRELSPDTKIYQAGSSEMFGNSVDEDGFQRKSTPFTPASPYGCSKVLAHNLCCHYREAYGMHICNGILFNHESPRRGITFVTNKVVKGAVEIYKKKKDKLYLGNLDAYRDWGHSSDYVRAMHMILNHENPDDWVVATGESHSVRQLCEYVFSKLGMDYQEYVEVDARFERPHEINHLKGDSHEIRDVLGWKPVFTFEIMLDHMIQHWLDVYDTSLFSEEWSTI